jgi:hypothetical protein
LEDVQFTLDLQENPQFGLQRLPAGDMISVAISKKRQKAFTSWIWRKARRAMKTTGADVRGPR